MGVKEIAIILILVVVVAVAVFFIIYPAGMGGRKIETATIPRFILMSPSFGNGGDIPEKYTCSGADLSPPLSWSGFPAGAKSFVIVMEDPDAPGGIFTHWIVYNISSRITKLPEGVKAAERLGGILQGINSFGKIGYGGPCPPPGSRHRYYFRIYALDTYLNLPPGATREEILEAVKGHVIAEAELLGYYGR